MANTFAIGGQASQVQGPASPVFGPTGVQYQGPGARPQALQKVQTKDNPTGDLIMSLGAKVVGHYAEQANAEAFLRGAQRAAAGDALKDIVDEQPWYSQIFGPSATVQGARSVAKVKQVDEYVASVYGDMPELQKLSSEEFGQEVNRRMAGMLTGDPITDVAIQQKMVEAGGPLFNAHAKANYKYLQTTMQQEVSGMMMAAGNTLQRASTQLREGMMSQEDWDIQRSTAASALVPIQGQSPESYWAAVQESTIDAMANGNHHFAGVVFSSGLLDAAPMKVRKALIDARQTYEARTIAKEGFLEYGAAIGKLQGMARAGQISPAALAQDVNRINEDFRMRTGIESDLLDRKEFSKMLAGNYASLYRKAEANAKEARTANAKVAEDMYRANQIHQALLSGAGNLAIAAGNKKAEVDALAWGVIDAAVGAGGSPAEFLINNYNNGAAYVQPQYANVMQSALRASKGEGYSGKAFDRAYSMSRDLIDKPGGSATMMAYLGEENGSRMLDYDALLRSGVTPEFAYASAFGEPIDRSKRTTDKEAMAKLTEVVEQQEAGWWSRKVSGEHFLNPAAKRVLAGAVAQTVDMLGANTPLGDAKYNVAMDVAKQKVDVIGAYAYHKKPGQQPLAALLGADDETAGKFFADVLAQDAYKQGIKLPGNVVEDPAELNSDTVFNALDVLGPVRRAAFGVFSSDEVPDVPLIRGADRTDPETGLTYSTLSATVVMPDGSMAVMSYDTRDLRKQYEQSKYFK